MFKNRIQIAICFMLFTPLASFSADSLVTCESIEPCKGKTDILAYSCLYHEMSGKSEYDNTLCKKQIVEIGKKSMAPMILGCAPEAMTYCHMKKDIDLLKCLNKIKDNDGIASNCRSKIYKAGDKLAELVMERFPDNSLDSKTKIKQSEPSGK